MIRPPPDRATLEAATRGESAAWAQLHHDWAAVVLSWCVYLGSGRIDSDEAAAEVFVRLWRCIERVQGPERFRAFIYGVTRRVVSEHRRSAWIRRWTGSEVPDHADPAAGPERVTAAHRMALAVDAVLDAMSARDREVLVLCDVQGLSAAEAAEILDLNLSSTKTRLSRARERFHASVRRKSLLPMETHRA